MLPYGDQWEAVEFYRQWITNKQPLLHLLFVQHNEHHIVPTRLAFLADFATSCILPIGRISRIIIAAAAIFAIATFFTGYVFSDHRNRFAASFGSLGEIEQFLFFIPTFLGAFAHHFGSATSFVIGLLGICIWLVLAIVFVIGLRTGKVVDAASAPMLMLAAAALATAVMVAVGRTGIGLQEAMASKYATWGLLFWLALLAAADRMWAAQSRPNSAIVCAGAVILVLSSLSGKGPLSSGRERARLLEDMTIRLQSGGVPENLKSIYPNPANVLSWLEFLRQHRMSIFADEAMGRQGSGATRGLRTQGSRT